jgi:hypothetical protein
MSLSAAVLMIMQRMYGIFVAAFSGAVSSVHAVCVTFAHALFVSTARFFAHVP